MEKTRLYLRLARLGLVLLARMHGPWKGVFDLFSEVEAIHRDLGHSYNPHMILPQHQQPLLKGRL